MEQVWKRHIAEGIMFLSVHDEIITKRKDAELSEKIFRGVLDKEFKSYKLNTKT